MSDTKPSANPALLAALKRVRAEDEATREAATKEVDELIKDNATVADVMAVIETASSGDLPPAKFKWESSDGNLLRTVWGKTTDDHVPAVVRRFDSFTTAGRTDALALLAQTETKAATEGYVAVLRKYGWPEQSWPTMTAAVSVVPLRELLERDRALEDLFREPMGSVFERRSCADAFSVVADWLPDEE
jgi:hypothetical protein